MRDDPWDEDQAARYDLEHARLDTSATIRYLAELAVGRSVLEFGVGTGRLAIPLAESASRVVGVDSSHAMLRKAVQAQPRPNVTFIEGDVTSWASQERFDLVLCLYNLLLLFTTQDAQLAVVRNAAAHLVPGGKLIIENIHPPLRALEEGETVAVLNLPNVDMAIKTQVLDWKSFQMEQKVLYVTNGVCRSREFESRMLLPSEQDLMARMAGLRLVNRMGSWRGTPWRADHNSCAKSNVISIYERPVLHQHEPCRRYFRRPYPPKLSCCRGCIPPPIWLRWLIAGSRAKQGAGTPQKARVHGKSAVGGWRGLLPMAWRGLPCLARDGQGRARPRKCSAAWHAINTFRWHARLVEGIMFPVWGGLD